MTGSESTRTRGRPLVAVLAVFWVGLGFWAIEGGDMWRGAAWIGLSALSGATYLWPESRFAHYMEKPIFRRKKHTEQAVRPTAGEPQRAGVVG